MKWVPYARSDHHSYRSVRHTQCRGVIRFHYSGRRAGWRCDKCARFWSAERMSVPDIDPMLAEWFEGYIEEGETRPTLLVWLDDGTTKYSTAVDRANLNPDNTVAGHPPHVRWSYFEAAN